MSRNLMITAVSTLLLLLVGILDDPSWWAFTIMGLTTLGFWLVNRGELRPTRNLLLVLGLSSLLLSTVIVIPVLNNPRLPWTGISCMVAAAASVALILSGIGKNEAKNIIFLILTAFVTFIAGRAIGSFDLFIGGFAIILLQYLALAVAAAVARIPFWRSMILVAPQLLLPFIRLLVDDATGFQDVVLVYEPILAIALFVGVYWVTMLRNWIGLATAALPVVLVSGYFLFIGQHLFNNLQTPIHQSIGSYHFQTLSGSNVTSEQLSGKVVWLSFYNSTCVACARELPHVAAVAEKYKENPQVAFYALNSIHYESYEIFKSNKLFHELGVTTAYESEDNLASAFAPNGVPVGILIDRKGVAIKKKDGFMESDATYFEDWLIEEIEKLLQGPV